MIRFHDDFHRKAREKQKRWYHKHKEKERGPFRSAKHGGYVLFSLGEKYVAISRSGAIVPWILAVWRWRHSLPANNEFGAWLRTLDAPPEHRVLLSAGGQPDIPRNARRAPGAYGGNWHGARIPPRRQD